MLGVLLLSSALFLARDGAIQFGPDNRYVYHIRQADEVTRQCGDDNMACFFKRRTGVWEVWLLDSLRAAIYVCTNVIAWEEGLFSWLRIQHDLAQVLPLILYDRPAPSAPICFQQQRHDAVNRWGLHLSTEEWILSGQPLASSGAESVLLGGFISDIYFKPLKGKIEVRDLNHQIVAEAEADENGDFSMAIPQGTYFVRAYLSDGRTEGLDIAIVGPRGHLVDWVIGLTE